jgi:DNA repair protein RecN (Recombination protein N)
MIKTLLIKNYALIQNLSMAPSPNLTTITGETGAGKSIMLGALGLLLGNRADTRALFSTDEKCVVEGTFDLRPYQYKSMFLLHDLDYSDECIIRREISPAGKSRAFINDTPVTLDIMKSIGDLLVDVHSQRDTLLLGAAAYQLFIIDTFAANQQEKEDYYVRYEAYISKQEAYQKLKTSAEELRREADFNQFLYEELHVANLQKDEQQQLEDELAILEHAEEIKARLVEATGILQQSELNTLGQMQAVLKHLQQVSRVAAHFQPLAERMESSLLELKDIAEALEGEEQKIEFDQARLEHVQQRLSLLFSLQQKHSVHTVEELLNLQHQLKQRLDRVSNLDDELELAQQEYTAAEQALLQSADKLTASRKSVFDPFKRKTEALLKDLAMPKAAVDFRHKTIKPGPEGADDIKILFSANAGVAPDDLKNVASGGEFSRLMFAVKYVLASKTALPTIVFDEIDTGISGEVAMKMVQMMRDMSARHQVIAITHLPQIAARGNAHFFVYKQSDGKGVSTRLRPLTGEERQHEIAKMIGGDSPSAAAIASAQELLAKN